MLFRKSHLLILLLIGVLSCQKKIDLKFKDSEPKLVIECEINDTDSIHYLKLTKSLGLNGAADFVGQSGAVINLTDQLGNTTTFTEIEAGRYASGVYFLNSGYNYTLSVTFEGENYVASSVLPTRVELEDLEFLESSFGGDDDRFLVPLRYDPAGEANFYRFKVIINDTLDGSIQIQDDEISDGLLQQQPLFGNSIPKVNDTCTVILNCIDQQIYDYLFTLQLNSPGGSATPANPKTNFSGNCLGYFSAQTKSVLTEIVE